MNKVKLIGLIILLNTMTAWSKDRLDIVVVGLFSNQAVVQINKKQRLLKVGNASPEGVKLISANSNSAVLEINGEKKSYQLGKHINSGYTPPKSKAMVTIYPTNGMYQTVGSINGHSVDFLVDTGASSIALNKSTAKRLDLDYRQGEKIQVTTASGVERAYRITLDKVQVGDIILYDIQAVVINNEQPKRALLGMTFLGQLVIEQKDEKMNLRVKY